MEVGCLRHPGAVVGNSQMETAPIAGKSWKPSYEPPSSSSNNNNNTNTNTNNNSNALFALNT